MYVICASPLAKIFIPEFQKILAKDFSKLTDETIPFTVKYRSSWCSYSFEYNKPKLLQPRVGANKTEIDWAFFTEFLTGGDSGMEYGNETDMTGIVKLPVENDVTSILASMIESGSKPTTKIEKMVGESRDKAKKLSEARIIKAAKRIYEGYRRQSDIAKENKIEYLATPTEFLCLKLLADYVYEKEGYMRQMQREADEINKRIQDSGSAIMGA